MLRNATCGLSFVLGFLGSPSIGCGPSDQFTYGESDMERAVVGTYSGSAMDAGTGETFTLKIAQASAATGTQTSPLRIQCATRTFVKPAGACGSESVMLLTAEFQSDQQSVPDSQMAGEFTAFRTLVGGLDLMGAGVHLSASYADGHFSNWSYALAPSTEPSTAGEVQTVREIAAYATRSSVRLGAARRGPSFRFSLTGKTTIGTPAC